jgi:hypothetical protein
MAKETFTDPRTGVIYEMTLSRNTLQVKKMTTGRIVVVRLNNLIDTLDFDDQ